MPIIKNSNGMSISGKEFEQYLELHERCKNKQSVKDLLQQIKKEDLMDMLAFYKPTYFGSDYTDYLSVIHVAAQYGNLVALKELSDAGAGFQIFTSNRGRNPLHLAASENHPEVVEYLITEKKLGVDTPRASTANNSQNITALMECASNRSYESAVVLILHNANVNHQTINGSTALHYACANGFGLSSAEKNEKVIDLLIAHHADPRLITSNSTYCSFGKGRRPIDVIKCYDSVEAGNRVRKKLIEAELNLNSRKHQSNTEIAIQQLTELKNSIEIQLQSQ